MLRGARALGLLLDDVAERCFVVADDVMALHLSPLFVSFLQWVLSTKTFTDFPGFVHFHNFPGLLNYHTVIRKPLYNVYPHHQNSSDAATPQLR